MSRTADLKAKFAAKGREALKERGSPRGRFVTALHIFVERMHAASAHDARFEDELFRRFERDAPTDVDAWLATATGGLFRSVSHPPRWIDEPDWAFHEGVPLEFVAQFDDGDGRRNYVFRGFEDVAIGPLRLAGKRAFYKMRAQDPDGRIHMDGVIRDTIDSSESG